MDIKLKKYKKPVFIAIFAVCVLSLLTACVTFTGWIKAGNLYYAWYEPGLYLERKGAPIWRIENWGHEMQVWLVVTIVAVVLALACLTYLLFTVGEKGEDEKIQLNGFDKFFTEFQLICIIFLLVNAGGMFLANIDTFIYEDFGEREQYLTSAEMVITIPVGLIAAILGLALILSCAKKLKAGTFISNSFCLWIFGKIQDIYMGGSTMHKVVLVAIGICLLSATIFLAPVVLILVLVYAPKMVKKYDAIKAGIKEVNSGNVEYKIPVDENSLGELDQLAMGINKVSEATNIAVQNEIKIQRMKTDLISNVSHDLKTPLTSMVTYIDLLKTTGLDNERAPEYLEILSEKTNRLRFLTEDLFEAAKASSGATKVRFSRVDLQSLVNQGLGEMDQRIKDANLEFILTTKQDRSYVNADGQLVWRVIENLLGNALKYSMENTRVYIDIKEKETPDGQPNMIVMEMKNISKYPLNIDANDLTERFKRGDEARTTEGSGLGLAIAKDLAKLMDGELALEIDGDMFKARVMLQVASIDQPITPDFSKEEKAAELEAEIEMSGVTKTEEEIKEKDSEETPKE
ncbi:MAG: HAMP domain-containing sensor histidine kinase [Anaerovoracaceae bacterium]